MEITNHEKKGRAQSGVEPGSLNNRSRLLTAKPQFSCLNTVTSLTTARQHLMQPEALTKRGRLGNNNTKTTGRDLTLPMTLSPRKPFYVYFFIIHVISLI